MGTGIDQLRTIEDTLHTLHTLVISRQRLDELPDCLGNMHSLRVLDASNNMITALPERVMCRLTQLQELLVSSNRLTDLPPSLASLKSLHVLSLQNNNFEALPAVVLRCHSLRTLRWGLQSIAASTADTKQVLDSSQLQCFSSSELRVLEMESNGQSCLPPLHGDPQVRPELTAFLASFNSFGSFPEQLSSYGASLRRVQLGTNGIASIDAAILSALPGLTCLMLEANQLKDLPGTLGELTELRELAVYGNCLQRLPDELGCCVSLTKLDAHHNELQTLPRTMVALSKLKSLYVQHNQLGSLGTLNAQIFEHLIDLMNLGLGSNRFDLREEPFNRPGLRLGLAWNAYGPLFDSPLYGVLTDTLATTDHIFDAASPGARAEVLLVAFAAQGAGMQQWTSPCAAVRGAGLAVDVLYLADPSNSYYMQSPCGQWQGLQYFHELIEHHSKTGYSKVFLVGSSMGATAALMHAGLAHRVLAFGPRATQLNLTHGSFLPRSSQQALSTAVLSAVSTTRASVSIHVGSGNLEDMLQAQRLSASVAEARGGSGLIIKCHDTFQHNVPMHLEREGTLVSLFKKELTLLLVQQ